MKSTDIALILVIGIVSICISYFATNAIMGDPNEKVETIEYINDISGVITEPDAEIFNAKALNLNEDASIGKCDYEMIFDGIRCVTQEEYNKEMRGETVNPDDNTD